MPPSLAVGLISFILVAGCLLAAVQTPGRLSAQGCRMSWMSPSYQLQDALDESWTPLARRYSLWLYREVSWEHELHGQPVLFIPGHAGSSRQVRSIASSSTRQFFSEPGVPSLSAPIMPADYFALEFNEDFSALHGPTLAAQRTYASAAVSYILSLYPAGTQVVLLGHSMGGVVATSLLPNRNVSVLITMATPHGLPPARFDRRIADLYAHNDEVVANDPTPIVSICGGATDTLVPSESCILPEHRSDPTGVTNLPYRRTVFASALEGAWTGVGHLAIVWCHQVRWRVARAVLELSASKSPQVRRDVLDKWLSDGSHLPITPEPSKVVSVDSGSIVTDHILRISNPSSPQTYLLPLPTAPQRFTLLLSAGSIPPIGPQHVGSLRVSVLQCSSTEHCIPLTPDVHKLIPRPIPNKPFPVPEEGADESEGVVLFEVSILGKQTGTEQYIAVRIDTADGRGALVAGLSPPEPFSTPSFGSWILQWISVIIGQTTINLNSDALSTHIHLPSLLSHVLLAYRATPHFEQPGACQADSAVLHPLLALHSPHETHYHPLHPSFPPALLHAHAGAPYLPSPATGLNLTIHASSEPGCRLQKLDITLDWWATAGRWGARLWPVLVSSAVGITALSLFSALSATESGSPMPSLSSTLSTFTSRLLGPLMLSALGVSLLPLPESIGLGTAGSPLFAPLAPLIIFSATGLVVLSAFFLRILLFLFGTLFAIFSYIPLPRTRSPSTQGQDRRRSIRSSIISFSLIVIVVLLFVPWQVAFLVCWLLHFYSTAIALCSSFSQPQTRARSSPPTPIALVAMTQPPSSSRPSSPSRSSPPPSVKTTNAASGSGLHIAVHLNQHILLLLTWLLPLVAPVLAVWARTLITAGWTVPFDGDHNVLYAAPFLVLVDLLSSSPDPSTLLTTHRKERISARWGLALMASVCFLFGARRTYLIFDLAALSIGVLVVCRIVPRYVS